VVCFFEVLQLEPFLPMHATCTADLILFDLITTIIGNEKNYGDPTYVFFSVSVLLSLSEAQYSS
jgi:hypothetical protein